MVDNHRRIVDRLEGINNNNNNNNNNRKVVVVVKVFPPQLHNTLNLNMFSNSNRLQARALTLTEEEVEEGVGKVEEEVGEEVGEGGGGEVEGRAGESRRGEKNKGEGGGCDCTLITLFNIRRPSAFLFGIYTFLLFMSRVVEYVPKFILLRFDVSRLACSQPSG